MPLQMRVLGEFFSEAVGEAAGKAGATIGKSAEKIKNLHNKLKRPKRHKVKEAKTNVSKEAEEAASTPKYVKNYMDKTNFTAEDGTHYRKYNDKDGNPVYEYKNKGEKAWSPIPENQGRSPSKEYGYQRTKFINGQRKLEQQAMGSASEEAADVAEGISKTATGDGDGIGLLDLASKHPIVTGLSAFGLGYVLSDGDDYE